ncbi:erythromycin esterase family protein [Metabacillus halosaccharovorans]|uniref:erythromycin esterase family protein n=1 Tax=Metabacillus halosaccharovorans TaxID=930124 RepID=UPI0037369677
MKMSVNLIQSIKEVSNPFHKDEDVDALVSKVKNETFVLLGESSHGTSEFYKIRAELSKKLITEKGFMYIAVEGDWPACHQINNYIKGYDDTFSNTREVLASFHRWPTWMWANEEMIELIDWLKDYNSNKPNDKKVGFYGIDVYSLWESIDEIIAYLEKIQSPQIEIAKKAFSCFEPFNRRPEKYGLSASFYGEDCLNEVTKLLTEIILNKLTISDSEDRLNLEVNTMTTANAENYYRTMVVNDNESWNIRDRHMVEVLNKIHEFYGAHAKGIVWEHNTHVGDARATDMATEGVVNVGQLLREEKGAETIFIIGFGTHRGTVIAADEWGVAPEQMIIPPAQTGSWEDFMHKAGPHDKFIHFTKHNRHLFQKPIGHRAIGVVYNPAYEQYGNYVPSAMSNRYDVFIYINVTNALHPLTVEEVFL